MSSVRHVIAWNTRDRSLIHKVCRYLGVSPCMSISRTTSVGTLSQEQLKALEGLVAGRYIQIRTFREA